jgi:hypothetical protein
MAGLVPAIHVLFLLFLLRKKDVDARDKRGHDGSLVSAPARRALIRRRR